jgi:exonuclease VII large subunit
LKAGQHFVLLTPLGKKIKITQSPPNNDSNMATVQFNANAEEMTELPLDDVLDMILDEPAAISDDGMKVSHEDSYNDTASDDSSITTQSSHNDPTAQELLEKAHMRLQLAEYERIISGLREEVIENNKKIANLTCQLKRATASKCDLVVACSDIESQKLNIEEMHQREERKWKSLPHKEQEFRAEVEREFMNELTLLTNMMEDLKRRHHNEVLEKDFEIAKFQEKLRRLEQGE